jgi:DNA polymerase-3 subunit delta'
MNIFDWQTLLWQQLFGDLDNLPHALLLAGPQGQGKQAFALAMAARLLCEQTGGATDAMACGQCSSCIWLASGNHPDFRLVQPDDEDEVADGESAGEAAPVRAATRKPAISNGNIRIDQVRALSDFVFVGSHRHGSRVVVVSPAEAMNPAAANALLKVLEEPPAGVYFILISNAWRRLLPTIRSRCRTIVFGRPDPLLATQWLTAEGVKAAAADELLRLAGGAPLLAAEWANQGRLDLYRKAIDALAEKPVDPVAMAAKWSALLKGEESFGLPQLVETVQKWVFDLILLKMSGGLRYHQAWRSKLEMLAARASGGNLLACYNDLLRIRAVARHPLNTQLFLEDMAARYLKAVAASRA